MKQILISLLGGILIFTACAPATTESTQLPSPSPTPTLIPATFTPSPTQIPPTQTITPLPTIPTFTPTFDARTIVTVTPAAKAECPKVDSTIKVKKYLPEKLEYPSPSTTSKILDFLNKGGDSQTLITRLKQVYPYGGEYRGGYGFYDVTGDQSPEFLYVEINYEGRLLAFSCKNGKYELLATLPEEGDFLEYTIMQIVDLNMNGIPEMIVMGTGGVSFPQSIIYLYEWNGQTFSIMGQAGILSLRQTQIKDIDGNGIKEILFVGDNPTCLSCSNFIPQRQRTITLGWNGKNFVETSNEFEAPEYRFQAIQDADAAVVVGNYEKAIHLYEEAISNKDLEWWSPERMQYKQSTYVWLPGVTPPAIPLEDKTEYPRLAAYAYYRIMLLELVQGQRSDAETTYNTLQQKFSNDLYAQPYAEMATAFWEAYQSAHKMYDGCAAAIEYAAEHPQILIPLGSDYHGSQSHIYVPEDVCPFR